MTNEVNEGMEPLKSVLMAGYMIAKARSYSYEYLNKATSCTDTAKGDINDHLGYEAVQNTDLGSLRAKILKVLVSFEELEHEHLKYSKKLEDLGFRKILSSDFSPSGILGHQGGVTGR